MLPLCNAFVGCVSVGDNACALENDVVVKFNFESDVGVADDNDGDENRLFFVVVGDNIDVAVIVELFIVSGVVVPVKFNVNLSPPFMFFFCFRGNNEEFMKGNAKFLCKEEKQKYEKHETNKMTHK